MKIALLGYGKMGKEIEKIALERGHEINLKIDIHNLSDCIPANLSLSDVAIDFSIPDSAYDNIMKCFEANVPVVCGTTGWLSHFDEVIKKCQEQQRAFLYSSNFSVGMNVFFAVNKHLSAIMNSLSGYEPSMKEIHHIHKLDAPSGTAISLANDLIACVDRKSKWELNKASGTESICIQAVRENEVPGTHVIAWDSAVDRIEIMHEAKSRKGLALGALMAAEFLQGKKGIFTMQDVIKL